MATYKKTLACAGLLLVHAYSTTMATDRNLYIHTGHYPCHHRPLTWKELLTGVGVVGGIAGLVFGGKLLYDYFHWTDELYIEWATQRIDGLSSFYSFLNNGQLVLDQKNPTFITQMTEFGFVTCYRMDRTLRAAAPLHNAVDRMYTDFTDLCSIIKECGRRQIIDNTLIEAALHDARTLAKAMRAISKTMEYQKEIVEIEKLENSRQSIHLQQAAFFDRLYDNLRPCCCHNEIIVVEG